MQIIWNLLLYLIQNWNDAPLEEAKQEFLCTNMEAVRCFVWTDPELIEALCKVVQVLHLVCREVQLQILAQTWNSVGLVGRRSLWGGVGSIVYC